VIKFRLRKLWLNYSSAIVTSVFTGRRKLACQWSPREEQLAAGLPVELWSMVKNMGASIYM
jgi:hypothetical protein